MGPILQEKVSCKERTWSRSGEQSKGPASPKKGKMNQKYRCQRKVAAPPKSSPQPQCKNPQPAVEKDVQLRRTRVKSELSRATDAGTAPPRSRVWVPPAAGGEECKEQQGLCRGRGSKRNKGGKGQDRRTQSLPVALPSDDLEVLWRREQEEPDSTSDLSDSERLPLLPSSHNPPLLDLQAEAIDSHPLQPHHPEPRAPYLGGQSYPDVLPVPFNTWSLRQLAVFLHTEGRQAPRPRAAARFERYLERLLQLEWLQVQTIQEEKGKPTAPVTVSRPRPHTAPPSSLSSPRCLRHCQRAFPLAFLSSLAEPAAGGLSGRVCPHCRVRYPFCNGGCPLYGYQHYPSLDAVSQCRGRGSAPPSRSCSESRPGLSHQSQTPGTPEGGSSHLQRMQAPGNIRRPTGSQGPKMRPLSGPPCVRSRASRSEVLQGGAGPSFESEKDSSLVNLVQDNCAQVGSGGRVLKTNPVASCKNLSPITRESAGAKVKFVTE
ncbi:hypothetical protein GN956_G5467 [Arapaima gigas]